MKRLFLLSGVLFIIINSDLICQSRAENYKNFSDAESLVLFGDYKNAVQLYLPLLKIYPNNDYFKYRIGRCYLYMPGEKKKAISYLEDAVKNIRPDSYKEGRFRETAAPFDALNCLATAYLINNELDKALKTYKTFKENINSEVYDTVLVNLQINSCLTAKELMSNPVYVKEKNLGENINESYSEFNPVVSDNGDLLIFSRSLPFYDAILYSTRVKGQWSVPLNMNELLKVDQDIYPTSISSDNKTLYLYNSVGYDGNIFTTKFEHGKWSALVKLNDNINTKYWESHATISHDNSKLYFTSNRNGTLGGLDIYVSHRGIDGDWGPAINLGPVINTPYNEESPFLSDNDKTLFFSSRGHLNMGGYDIFYSTQLADGSWSVPLNMGYPLNTTDDDLFYKPQNDGFIGYIARDDPGGYGKQDIYQVEVFSSDHPRKFFVKGMVKAADQLNNMKDRVKISTRSINKTNKTLIAYSNPETGRYEFNVPQGNFEITYEGEGGSKFVRNIVLPLTNPSDTFEIPTTILPKSDFIASLNTGNKETIPDMKGDTIHLPLKVDQKSPLTTEKNGQQINKITDKEIAELLAKLLNRATGKLHDVIANASIEGKHFGRVDDLIDYLKEEAARKGINPEELDRLALRVAVMDNILTQAAVDYLEKYTDGDLKKILSGIDIYKSNLKTWTDLLKYISGMSGGKINSDELNKIAADLLTDTDPDISKLREKILTFGKNYDEARIVVNSVAILDLSNIKTKGKWLQAFYNESVKQGLTPGKLSEMLVMVSSYPGTGIEQFLSDLIKQAEEPLLSSLKSIDLSREKIKSPVDLLMFLLANKDKIKYPEEAVFLSIAKLIIANNVPSDLIVSRLTTGKDHGLWVLWIVTAAGILIFFIFFRKKKKPNSK
jgi:tetratricopeptide (TPR) repeat protein